MEGHINRQGFSYRQGLVLGLTMAEIMVLLVFCLLIAMATFLKSEQTKLADAQIKIGELEKQRESDRASLAAHHTEAGLAEKLTQLAGSDPGKVDEYWRDLVNSKDTLSKLTADGTTLDELKEKSSELSILKKAGIDANKALSDADLVAAIKRALPDSAKASLTPQMISEMIVRAIAPATSTPSSGTSGHQWPPIINLSEANGYSFRSGSAELSKAFHDALLEKTVDEILAKIRQFDVDVIEVVGHTDEQAYGPRTVTPVQDTATPLPLVQPIQRQSNLDRGLITFLKNGGDIARLTPVDNAGLGLARAASVVSVLRTSPKLNGYKMIPLSGGQLINIDETLALNGSSSGDIAQRRRIEIRLRKSAPHEASAAIAPAPTVQNPPRSAPKPTPVRSRAPIPLVPAPARPAGPFGLLGN
jgi:flagellar motor protein MotB